MKLTTVLAVLALLVSASVSWAADDMSGGHPGMAEHNSIGLGFRNTDAPIGIRWWLSGQKLGIDAGIGFGSASQGGNSVSHWAVDFGVPFVLKSWDRVHFIARPGVTFGSQDVVTGIAPFTTDTETSFAISGELEAEVFLAPNVSVSASHGIAYQSVNPPGPGDNVTSFSTIGNNFTQVGFHIYLWGPYTGNMMSH